MADQKLNLTPLMRQYFEIKEQYPDSLLLFQVGDFYEMFFDDAKKASAFLGIALTKRGTMNDEPIPLCGVPMHAVDHYMVKLVKGGFKVAICDQLEEPQPGKVVERGVTQVLTPGTLTDSKLLDEKTASYLLSFFPSGNYCGLVFSELLTAQMFATVLPIDGKKSLESELSRFFPDEILIPVQKESVGFGTFFKEQGFFTTYSEFDKHDSDLMGAARGWMSRQFKEQAKEVLDKQEALRFALFNFYSYMRKTQESSLEHFKKLNFYEPEDFLILDAATQRNLELVRNNQDGSVNNSLFQHMDKAVTSMGSRMIKKWILRPLVKKESIEFRQDAIAHLVGNVTQSIKLEELLNQVGDVERIVGRIALKRASLNDYLMLRNTLGILPELKKWFSQQNDLTLFRLIDSKIIDFSALYLKLQNSLNDDLDKNWLIKLGFDQALDDLRELVENSNQKILELERKEQEKSGINSLKIRYNRVQGYYFEVTKPNIHLVPDYFVKHQMLVGKERFMTNELKALQSDILSAHTRIDQVEKSVYESIKQQIFSRISDLRHLSQALANLDALLGFGRLAYQNGYSRPNLTPNRDILIEDGRHPVIEGRLGDSFISNNTYLTDKESLWIITGPNMGGKSTYLRQVALICLMAQIGSFVPAKSATLPILDRIFTRVGASDSLAEGKSTFLVEMEETASICGLATNRSLVILDEVGRGTSTFDGLAIAQAVVEFIYQNIGARCLFATHYHELTALKDSFPGIASYFAASKKTKDGILFLHKIVKGVADGSFGLEVAKLANLPKDLIIRAQAILEILNLEEQQHGKNTSMHFSGARQANLFEPIRASVPNGDLAQENIRLKNELEKYKSELILKNKYLELIWEIDFDDLSPKKALDVLWHIKDNFLI
ncbi:MAG: mismatch repair protein MutS protein [candidate division TM6 bacterium GW2011_GWF2_32_72]|nr:MAG: mismatch repair protein MutS protein [candidate division TM6 bacterium GW2011_GWF2_32_72]